MAVSKRALAAGERLDGEGGYMVYGRLAPAQLSVAQRALPIGLANGLRLRNEVPAGVVVRWDDVEVDQSVLAVQLRRQLEQAMSTVDQPSQAPGKHV
jgi:predicted homoserine dehydrogenase-like protein